MEFFEIVRTITDEMGMTSDSLSRKIGRNPRYISASRRKHCVPRVGTAALIAKACGHKLCVIPKDSVPDDAYVIEPRKP